MADKIAYLGRDIQDAITVGILDEHLNVVHKKFIIICYDTKGSIFRIIIGIWIIYTSLVRISSSIKMRKIDGNIWIFSLILAILMFACGVYTIANSGVIVVTIGSIIIIYSIIDIIENIIFMKNIKDIS